MAIRIAAPKDLGAGILFSSIAILGLWVSRDYPIGTSTNMNFGYMPRLLCWVLLGLGAVIILKGLMVRGERIPAWPWRPLVMVTLSMVVFGFAIHSLGLAVASVALIVCGAFAGRDIRPRELAITALLLTAGTIIVFVHILDLPIAVWPPFL